MPATRSLAEALNSQEALGALLDRWRIAQQCMQAARTVIGPDLAALLRPGPVDEGTWVMLADSGPAAAKARQLLPRIQGQLTQQGLPIREVRVRVSPRAVASSLR